MSSQEAVGFTLSSTVTEASHVDTFPLTSVTVSVTVFTPTCEQSKSKSSCPESTVTEATSQLSEEPPSISAEVIVKSPFPSNWTMISWQIAVGLIVSSTVTIAVHVVTFPVLSVAVSVTVFGPTFEQSNWSGETVIEANPQLALAPAFTSPGVIEVLPDPSK